MIISLFGPDGVGKSMYADKLAQEGYAIINGCDISSWPDKEWHEQFIEAGIDESMIDSNEHFIDKIERFYHLLGDLSLRDIVIDSDPLHKTLLHDYSRALRASEDPEERVRERFQYLSNVAGLDRYPNQEHHLLLPDRGFDVQSQAIELQRRITKRGKATYFDPKTVEESKIALQASWCLMDVLASAGLKTYTRRV